MIGVNIPGCWLGNSRVRFQDQNSEMCFYGQTLSRLINQLLIIIERREKFALPKKASLSGLAYGGEFMPV